MQSDLDEPLYMENGDSTAFTEVTTRPSPRPQFKTSSKNRRQTSTVDEAIKKLVRQSFATSHINNQADDWALTSWNHYMVFSNWMVMEVAPLSGQGVGILSTEDTRRRSASGSASIAASAHFKLLLRSIAHTARRSRLRY